MSIALASARMSTVYRRTPLSFSRARTLVTAKEETTLATTSSPVSKGSKDVGAGPRGRASPADMQNWKDRLAEFKEKQVQIRETHITKKLTFTQRSDKSEVQKHAQNAARVSAENEYTSRCLSCYADVCSEISEPLLGFEMLEVHRRQRATSIKNRKQVTEQPFGTPTMYRAFFKMAASHGDEEMCRQLVRMAEEDMIQLDEQMVGHICRAIAESPEVPRELQSAVVDTMEKLSMDPEALHSEIPYSSDSERDAVAAGLRRLFPGFVPDASRHLDMPDYETPLLSHLNVKDTTNLAPNRVCGTMDLFERQLRMERAGQITFNSVLPPVEGPDKVERINAEDKLAGEIIESWRTDLEDSLRRRLDVVTKALGDQTSLRKIIHHKTGQLAVVYPFLSLMPIEEYVDVLLQEVIKIMQDTEGYSTSLRRTEDELGAAVRNRFVARRMSEVRRVGEDSALEKYRRSYSAYLEWLKDPANGGEAWCHREAFLQCASGDVVNPVPQWPAPVRVAVGRELVNRLVFVTRILIDRDGNLTADESGFKHRAPAFTKPLEPRGKMMRHREELRPDRRLSKMFSQIRFRRLTFDANMLPMVCPPLPWISEKIGGNLLQPNDFVRADMGADNAGLLAEQESSKITSVMDALNLLGSTPWKINQPVLDQVIECFTNQSQYADFIDDLSIPRHRDMLHEPKALSAELSGKVKAGGYKDLGDDEQEMYKTHQVERAAFNQWKNECFSLWSDTLYRLSIANHFKNHVLYFPHNIDFRGRVYPLTPYFNHMGADLARSLLVFAEGKKLGPRGLYWLKLHAINLTGTMKRDSVEDRIRHADEIMDDIIDSASNPFDGKRWWLQSDDPWQTLATCIEIKNATDSGDPENFVSHLPIHQDGSCNGLQHYAALGRDVLGAGAVNLLPAEKPQDIYSEVAEIVERRRREDAKNGIAVASTLEGFVRRKVIKQTVMTTVYGVTAYGAKLQIARQLKDIEEFPAAGVDEASKYLADKTFQSLNELFQASQEIQAWLTDCAVFLSKEMQECVQWETPLGFAVRQPYVRKGASVWSSTADLENRSRVYAFTPITVRMGMKPNTVRNANGFPPNFVHSLDSSHMMMTALELWNRGITYASVHDCYWTHACSVEVMNEVCREQFINLHSFPIVEKLAEAFQERLGEGGESLSLVDQHKAEVLFKTVPKKGKLDLGEVRKSVYFFS